MDANEGRRSNVKKIIILLSVALVLRLVFFGLYQPWDAGVEKQKVIILDAVGYHNLAVSLLEHRQWGNNVPSRIQAIRTPLFPLFTAAVYTVSGNKPWAVLLMQVLLDTGTCILLFFTCRRLFDSRVGFIAALLYAVNPFQILQCSIFSSEILFIFVLLWGFHFFIRALEEERGERHKAAALYFALSGVFTGLSALTRPVSQYILLIFVGALIFICRRRLKTAVKYSLLFVLMFLAALAPWLLRNYKTHGRFFLSISGPYNLLVLNAAPMVAVERNKHVNRVQEELLAETDEKIVSEGKDPKTLDIVHKALYWQRTALTHIKANPFSYFKTYVKGVFYIFVSLGTSEFNEVLNLPATKLESNKYTNRFDKLRALISAENISTLVIAILLLGYLFTIYGGMVTGWFVSRKKYDRTVIYLCLLTALYFVAVTGAAGVFAARFRLPVIPFLLPPAAVGVVFLYEKIKVRIAGRPGLR